MIYEDASRGRGTCAELVAGTLQKGREIRWKTADRDQQGRRAPAGVVVEQLEQQPRLPGRIAGGAGEEFRPDDVARERIDAEHLTGARGSGDDLVTSS